MVYVFVAWVRAIDLKTATAKSFAVSVRKNTLWFFIEIQSENLVAQVDLMMLKEDLLIISLLSYLKNLTKELLVLYCL